MYCPPSVSAFSEHPSGKTQDTAQSDGRRALMLSMGKLQQRTIHHMRNKRRRVAQPKMFKLIEVYLRGGAGLVVVSHDRPRHLPFSFVTILVLSSSLLAFRDVFLLLSFSRRIRSYTDGSHSDGRASRRARGGGSPKTSSEDLLDLHCIRMFPFLHTHSNTLDSYTATGIDASVPRPEMVRLQRAPYRSLPPGGR